MLFQFDDVFVVMYGLKLLLYSVSHFCGKPDIGFEEVSQKFVSRVGHFLQVRSTSHTCTKSLGLRASGRRRPVNPFLI
jgi:hypothetical protein